MAARARRREHSGGERDFDGREERDGEPGARQTRAGRRRGSRRNEAARRYLLTHTWKQGGEPHALVCKAEGLPLRHNRLQKKGWGYIGG